MSFFTSNFCVSLEHELSFFILPFSVVPILHHERMRIPFFYHSARPLSFLQLLTTTFSLFGSIKMIQKLSDYLRSVCNFYWTELQKSATSTTEAIETSPWATEAFHSKQQMNKWITDEEGDEVEEEEELHKSSSSTQARGWIQWKVSWVGNIWRDERRLPVDLAVGALAKYSFPRAKQWNVVHYFFTAMVTRISREDNFELEGGKEELRFQTKEVEDF